GGQEYLFRTDQCRCHHDRDRRGPRPRPPPRPEARRLPPQAQGREARQDAREEEGGQGGAGMSTAADNSLLDSIERITSANQEGAERLSDQQLEQLAATLIAGDVERMR